MSVLLRAFGRTFRVPRDMSDEEKASFLEERSVEVDAVSGASPQVEPSTGAVRRAERDSDGVLTPIEEGQLTPHLNKTDLAAAIMIESSNNPKAANVHGYKGLLQFGAARASEVGVDDPFDPKQAVMGYTEHARQAAAALKKDGLEVNGFHIYLLHQQGMTGGRDILKNMDTPIVEFKRARNMLNNKPPTKRFKSLTNPTVRDWYEEWQRVYEDKTTAQVDLSQYLV